MPLSMKRMEGSSFTFRRQIIDLLEYNLHIMIHSVGKEDSVLDDAREAVHIIIRDIIGEDSFSACNRGRIFNRGLVADLIYHFRKKSLGEEDDDFWHELINDVNHVHKSLLRNDADQWVYPGEFRIPYNDEAKSNEAGPNTTTTVPASEPQISEYNKDLSNTLEFSDDCDHLIQQCRIQRYAFMITQLQRLQDNKDTKKDNYASFQAKAQECQQYVLKFFTNPPQRDRLLSVFQQPQHKGLLKESQEVNAILNDVADINSFHEFFTNTLCTWASMALSEPTLVKLQYGVQPRGASQLVDGGIRYRDKKASALQQATKGLSQTQRSGPDPTSVAEAIASKAIPDRRGSVARSVDEESSFSNKDSVMKKRRTSDDSSSSPVKGEDSRVRPKRKRIPTNFFHNEFTQKELYYGSTQGEIVDMLLIDSDGEKSPKAHRILTPAVANNINIDNSSPPRKNVKASPNKSSVSGQPDEGKEAENERSGCLEEQPVIHPEHSDNNQENQDVLATAPADNIETQEEARERKKKEIKITFDDSDTSIQSPDEQSREQSGAILSGNIRQTAVEASARLQGDMNRVLGTRRRFFTQEEKNALKLGIQKFGVGKWSLIKSEYSDIFRYRTAVQLKDLYRTMVKNMTV